ncbi:restriction endonuclease subunit S [Roseibacillus persicicus]|uniref:methylation-associated defense system restriction endonuclease subunit S MAD5 n=1 Tax=Roseibacillus persicicus TaxID=454148 RepID=UPI00398A70EB
MKTAIIRSSWMKGYGYRLDTMPYTRGALQTKIKLEELPLRKDTLGDITKSIHHAGRDARVWVEDPKYGVPFIGGSSLQKADLSGLPLMSKEQVDKKPIFRIQKGYTLITRSGTIGKMAYARDEMDGMACSEHVMRVVPDESKILPGYLYAFLSSKFGVPLIVSGTYGAIIQSIEPEHVLECPVPRLEPAKEKAIHDLVEEAAQLRSEASELRKQAIDEFSSAINRNSRHKRVLSTTVTSDARIARRLDAHYHSFESQQGRLALSHYEHTQSISDISHGVYSADRGSRKKVDSLEYGIPFLSSSVVFTTDPREDYLISKQSKKIDSFIIGETDLLIPRSGSIGGIIGRAVFPLPNIVGYAATEHLVHIRCKTKDDLYYLWTALASEPGYHAILSTAFGSAIPSLDCELIKNIKIPKLEMGRQRTIVSKVRKCALMAEEAIHKERKATQLLEETLDNA